ncbi:hypothetical protein [Burkholderia cenocepacia]|uniref:hypothetical protein n=1 Tax=Burkholderia cenocepacia TaxID=95486 RepID=UPI0007619AED|nr:hypothetical protein [Burkholderia cenocepacia]KWU26294.1 hypothetical protein AS149_25215 [Burkholderia cenocepacia]
MFTKESLRQMADMAEKSYRELLVLHPPGTVHDGRNDAHDLMDRARICADWMEAHGIEQTANIGPFMTTLPKRLQQVRIRKGARIFGTGPKIGREGEITQRARVVVVHSVDKGYIDTHTGRKWVDERHAPVVVQARVHWAGTGGYWRWTDIENVEIVGEQLAAA